MKTTVYLYLPNTAYLQYSGHRIYWIAGYLRWSLITSFHLEDSNSISGYHAVLTIVNGMISNCIALREWTAFDLFQAIAFAK